MSFRQRNFCPTAVAETQSAHLTPHRDCGKVRWGFADANCFARFFSATLFIYGTLSRGAGWELCLRARYNYIVIYKERLTKTIPLRWMKREARYQPNIVYNFIKKQVEQRLVNSMGLPFQNLYRMIISLFYCFFMLNIPRMCMVNPEKHIVYLRF